MTPIAPIAFGGMTFALETLAEAIAARGRSAVFMER